MTGGLLASSSQHGVSHRLSRNRHLSILWFGSAMSEPQTIILTNEDGALVSALAERLPGVRVLAGQSLPQYGEPAPGRTWWFVDWLLPDQSGLELCRRLRSAPATADSHITMILDEDDKDTRRRALRAGADDYVLAPLTSEVLLNRIACQRELASPRRDHGELTIDLAAHQARWKGKLVPLRPIELRLLSHFAEHPDRVYSRRDLISVLGKEDEVDDERTVDVWVGRLRRALKAGGVPDPLRTVRSLGYVLDSL